MDSLTKKQHGWNISWVRSKKTKPELSIQSFLSRKGGRFRLHVKKILGTPSFVMLKLKIVVGQCCFVHQHKHCRLANILETRANWWKTKLDENTERNKQNLNLLLNYGEHILLPLECFLDDPIHKYEQKTEVIQKALESFLAKNSFIELSGNGNTWLMEANQNG